jgi:hypothetical protein
VPLAARLSHLAPLPRWLALLAAERALALAARLAAVGGAAALGLAWVLAHTRPDAPRAWILVALVPAFAPFARLPWTVRRDAVALALTVDHRLGARAAVVTAVELALRDAPATPFTHRIAEDALRAVRERPARDTVRAPSRGTLGALGLALGLTITALTLPRVTPPEASTRPHRPTVHDSDLHSAARDALAALEAAQREDPAHAQALDASVAQARRLAEALAQGMPREEALAQQDALEREAQDALGWALASERQRALDAALGALDDRSLEALRRALARGDLRGTDAAVQALADQRERADRARAEVALSRAAEAARRAGASDLADALDAERALLQRRGARSALARALAQALGDDPRARRAAEHLARGGDHGSARALEEALQALERDLTPAERQRLTQALARLAREAPEGRSQEGLARAARAPTAQELRAALRALARGLDGADRTPGGGARRAGDGALGALGRLRVGLQTGRVPAGGARANSRDEGHDPLVGRSPGLRPPGFTAPVDARRDPRTPAAPVAVEWVDPTGDRALLPGAVTLQRAAPAALQGIEHAPVPEAYRAQVRGYFQTR